MSRDAYVQRMRPYAVDAGSRLGIPADVVLAQWAHETGYGSSSLARQHNNHGGIKASSGGKDYVAGAYAGYSSVSSFVNDYVRVMRLSYYDGVRAAGPRGAAAVIDALHRSPYAEDPAYGSKLQRIYDSIRGAVGGVGGSVQRPTPVVSRTADRIVIEGGGVDYSTVTGVLVALGAVAVLGYGVASAVSGLSGVDADEAW